MTFTACLFIDFCGTVGTGLYEGQVLGFNKTMFLEVVQKIESVVGQFCFMNVLVHITLDLVVYGIEWIRKKKKAPGIPPSATTKSIVKRSIP